MDLKKREELTQEAKNFFEAYKNKIIGESVREKENVMNIPHVYLSESSPATMDAVLDHPLETIAILEDALAQFGLPKNPRVRFTSLPEQSMVNIRHLRAKHLDLMVWIEGIIRQASDVRPQVVNAKFECRP